MDCCAANPLIGKQNPTNQHTSYDPMTRYNPLGSSPGKSYAATSVGDLVNTMYSAFQLANTLPTQMPSAPMYGVPSAKQGSGNYANTSVPVPNYMPMDMGYALTPSYGT